MKINANSPRESLENLRAQVFGSSVDRAHIITVGAICVVGFALRFLFLTHHSLDGDEFASYYFAHFSFLQLWTEELDTHPPLYYCVQKIMLALDDSESLFRAPVAVLGTLSVLLVYFLARRIAGGTAALLAAAFMATSPAQIYHSQWARPYALLTAAALATALAAIEIFSKYAKGASSMWGARALYALSLTIALYSHNLACLLFAVTAIFGLVPIVAGRSLKCMFEWTALNGVVLLSWSWWLIVVVHQAAAGLSNISWLAPPTLNSILYNLSTAYGLMFIGHSRLVIHVFTVVIFAIVLASIGIMKPRTVAGPIPLAYLVALVIGIPAAEIVISLIWRPIFMQTYIIWTVPFFYVLAAFVITSLHSLRAIAIALSGVAIMFVVDMTANYWKPSHEDYRALVDEVYTASQDGDVIVTGHPWVYAGINYYLSKHLPRALIVVDRSTTEMRSVAHLPPPSVQHLPPAADRVWFIGAVGDGDPELSAELAPYRLERRYDEHGVSAALYLNTRARP